MVNCIMLSTIIRLLYLDKDFQLPKSLRDHPVDEKSMPINNFISIFDGVDADVVSLQRQLPDHDHKILREQFGNRFSALSNATLHAQDQLDMMREVQKLDYMVTISTTTAHMAASVGIPMVLLNADRPYQQWFWPVQQVHGKVFYPSVKVLLGGSDKLTWWNACLEPAKAALLAMIGRSSGEEGCLPASAGNGAGSFYRARHPRLADTVEP